MSARARQNLEAARKALMSSLEKKPTPFLVRKYEIQVIRVHLRKEV